MPAYAAVALMIVLAAGVFAAGCISQQPLSDGTTAKSSALVTSSTPIPQSVQTPCPPPGNATPYIIINPIGNHTVGDVFEINGTTSLGVNEKIKIGIGVPPSSGGPPPRLPYNYSSITGYATLQNATCSSNFWLYSVNLSGFHAPSTYLVTVWEEPNYSATKSMRFIVYPDQTGIE
jgi:hypothetical protein